ncbi:MAG: response regulator transcription factor [Thalassovita sp.]
MWTLDIPALQIALVDDHALFLEGIRHLLTDNTTDLEPHVYQSSLLLLEEIDQGKSFDVIVTDLAMKEINGIALIGALRARGVDVPVIVLSAAEDAITRANTDLVGAFRFVHKSAEKEVLFDAIYSAAKSGPLPAGAVRRASNRHLIDKDGVDHVIQPQLGARQLKILSLVSTGATNKAIGEQLSISENTVKTHVKAIFRELGVKSRTEAVQRARSLALI